MAAGGGLAGWLFGRRTYQDLLTVWNARGGPFTDSLNATTTYVASSTLTEPVPWPSSILLAGDVVAAVRHVKARTEGVLAMMGGGVLLRSLTTANPVDEYLLMIHPLVLGAGLTVPHLTAPAGGQARLPGSAGARPWRLPVAAVRRDGVVQVVARGSQPRTGWLPGVSRSFP